MTKHSLILGLALGAGCATPLTGSLRLADKPLALQAQSTTARLVFVRPDRFMGSGVSAYFIDFATKQVLGKSVNQTAFAVDVAPGSHLICPVPTFEQALVRMDPQTAPAMATSTPVTRVTVEPGRTYYFWVSVHWGARIEAVPMKRDTLREKALLETLKEVRPVVLAPQLDDLVADELDEWLDHCRLSSGDDVRLNAEPQDGQLTAAPLPPSAL